MAKQPVLVPDSEGAGRFLPWVIAVMTFLATLMMAGALATDMAIRGWNTALTGTLTVEIAADPDADMGVRVEDAVTLLRATAGVRDARPLARDEIALLLEPWLGQNNLIDDLPVPRLIDVQLDNAHDLDIDRLADRLAERVPGARIDDHTAWLDRLVHLARGLQLLAAGIVLLIGLAMICVIVFATRAAFAAHHDVIEVLHLIGARDAYIARHFQNHALAMGLRGGLVGLVLAALTLVPLAYAANDLGMLVLPELLPPPLQAALLLLIPTSAALIALITARTTVLRALSRMP